MNKPYVTVYCSDHCGPCRALCEWLDYCHVSYMKVTDVREFPEGISHIPTLEVAGERIQGYDRMAITNLLAKNNLFPER